MEIIKSAVAGTLESSDALISIEPGSGELDIEIESSVMNQYGRQIRATILEVLSDMEVNSAHVRVTDKGALDCTLRARLECAIYRSIDQNEGYDWGGLLK